ncbi:MAG: hypothetical protein QF664_09700, partial [Dehalococcoidia bacterium]|nr:hypothetical protein [Dehalococcoidia bacterium]
MELADYVAIIRRWWWLLVASLIVGALLGYLGWTITSSDSYRATVALTSEEYRQVFESPPDVYEATTTLLVEIDRSRPEPSEPTVQWTITTGRQDAELDPINGGFIGGAISTVMAPDRESAIQLVRANVPPDHTQVLVIGIVPEMTPTGWSADKLEVALPTLLSQRRILEAAIGLAGLDFGTSDD